jgi:hypothetical protein
MPAPTPTIIDRTSSLPTYARSVLAAMFAGYRQVIVKSEFSGGFSGSRVFLVRPIKEDGAELPAVVKIDRAAHIQQEWQAYNTTIKNRLPHVAEIHGQPVYPPGSPWGGLWYPLLGAGTFEIESLHHYCQQAAIADIRYVLESRLFKSLDVLWSQTRQVQADLHLQTEYDSFLPVNLDIELAAPPASAQVHWLHPDSVNERPYRADDYVQVSGFRIVDIDHDSQRLTLDMPEDSHAAYRMYVRPVPEIENYEIGEIVHRPLTGVVGQTRQDLLRAKAAAALGSSVDVTAVTLLLTDDISLPNPLATLPALLNQMFDAHVAYIHGDLHLENILVEPENRNAYLIDFARAQRHHVLRDLLLLETAVVTKLLPEALLQTEQTPVVIDTFYRRLHCALHDPAQIRPPRGLEKPFAILESIRRAARPHLFQADKWDEYYYGLIIYLLGSLKFDNLDEMFGNSYPKQLAFWGAAVTNKLLESPPPCKEMSAKEAQDEETNMSSEKREDKSKRAQTETNFYGPVSPARYIPAVVASILATPAQEMTTPGRATGTPSRPTSLACSGCWPKWGKPTRAMWRRSVIKAGCKTISAVRVVLAIPIPAEQTGPKLLSSSTNSL